MNYQDKHFVAISNSPNGQVSGGVTFHYRQQENIIWATYQGDAIIMGTLVGRVIENNCLDFVYQHLTAENEFRTGRCKSIPEILPDGRLRLHEHWQWTSGDCSVGTSIIEEII